MKNIAFFYPSKEFGGAENLIIRVSKVLISMGHKITIIDYKGGIVISNLLNIPGICFLEYEDNKTIIVKDVTHLVSFSLWIEKMRNQIQTQNRIFLLIWFIHPHHILRLIQPLPRKLGKFVYFKYKSKIMQMLTLMNDKGCLQFMDFENYFISKEYFKLNFKPKYLQIPVNYDVKKQKLQVFSEEISIVWIGRLCIEKVSILIYVLDKVREYSIRNHHLIHFYIVGSGSYEGSLNEYIANNNFEYLKIIRIDRILPEEIPDFLSGKRVLFAMGTAALEGGVEKIPTVLLDYSFSDYNKIKQKGYKFKWLYQTKDFTLGSDIFKSYKYIKAENHLTIDNIFEILSNSLKSEAIAGECYNYSVKNHNMKSVVCKLLNDLESCIFTIDELLDINLDKNIFELTFDKAYNYGRKVKKCFFQRH
jgi:hypothetical protein